MHRTTFVLPLFALPWLLLACTSNAGQNGLQALPDGYIPIPSYEASPVEVFDGSFETGDGPADAPPDGSSDAPSDGHADAAMEAAPDSPPAEGAADAPHDGPG